MVLCNNKSVKTASVNLSSELTLTKGHRFFRAWFNTYF